ncbi:hypothetical protein KJ966_11355 [bacterium]|nr:hypothetical protein [bacterium]
MDKKNKDLFIGIGLLLGFAAVLTLMFMPLFQGNNLINKIDNLYNNISKGSAYYIPKLKKDAKSFSGQYIRLQLLIDNERLKGDLANLLNVNGIPSQSEDGQLIINADFGQLMGICLDDTDLMYANEGEKVRTRYGIQERRVLYTWWKGMQAIDKFLIKQKKYNESKLVSSIIQKGVEASYNYYGIEAQNIRDRVFMVVFSLMFYVVYTLWFGFAILFLFKGAGLKL